MPIKSIAVPYTHLIADQLVKSFYYINSPNAMPSTLVSHHVLIDDDDDLWYPPDVGPCPRGSFKCDNGSTCVAQRKMCDKHNDCDDKEDEHPATCGQCIVI